MIRRAFLQQLAAFATTATAPGLARAQSEAAQSGAPATAAEPGLQTTGPATPFDADTVIQRARALAAAPYSARQQVPESWRNLSYDQYRKIWFDGRNALWEGSDLPQRVDVFPPGLYFPRPVEINVVAGGAARPLAFDMGVFDHSDQFPDVEIDDSLGYSGLRLRAELEKQGVFQEYAVFQGASYFRGIGAGNTYGLSARGLALKTADPEGEEFPEFTALWLETPAPGATQVVVHALLDSPSCTGAYRFEITPGALLKMQISARIFAREELTHLGLAPLTSMFLFDDTMRDRFSDFRPAVHDSDGLLIHNGGGEVLWRPLRNHTTLQVSSFADENPRGFGLLQRKRGFSDFNDLEALYHNRPSVWITPEGDWGRGSVTLVEIPADLEIYDNIVAYWRPETPLPAGDEMQFGYSLHWGADPVSGSAQQPLSVLNTAIGGRMEGGQVVVIDFAPGAAVPDDLNDVEVALSNSETGEVSLAQPVVQRNPETGGPRVAFTFEPNALQSVEFRVQLRLNDAPLSEVWLYRWTAKT